MKVSALLLLCFPMLTLAGLITRQNLPPVCYNACLLSAVSVSGTCELFDTPCICSDAPIINTWVNCLYWTCSESDFPLALNAGDALCAPYEQVALASVEVPAVEYVAAGLIPVIEPKELAVPIKRQDMGLPPVCFNACLLSAVSEAGSCEMFDTPCICSDTPTLSLWLDCAQRTCSKSDFPLAVAAGDSFCAAYEGPLESSGAPPVGATSTVSSLAIVTTADLVMPSSGSVTPGVGSVVSPPGLVDTDTKSAFSVPLTSTATPGTTPGTTFTSTTTSSPTTSSPSGASLSRSMSGPTLLSAASVLILAFGGAGM